MEHIIDIENDSVAVLKWALPESEEGHDARGDYVERYWLPLLAPTSTWLIRRLATILDENPGGCSLSIKELSIDFGMGSEVRRKSPLVGAFDRLAHFDLLRPARFGAVEIKTELPTLAPRQVTRLSQAMQREHQQFVSNTSGPSINDMRTRAFALAVSMLNAGESREYVETQLMTWKFHPAVCFEAAEKAFNRQPKERVS